MSRLPDGAGAAPPARADERLPIVLVVLDGLGDRPVPELGGQTPAEAAATPVLNELARRGQSGLHLPFGWGRAPSSELAHWDLFGYGRLPFCGRSVLEALGAGMTPAPGDVLSYAALRCSVVRDGAVWITGRAAPSDEDDAGQLLESVGRHDAGGVRFALAPVGRGEAILSMSEPAGRSGGPSAAVSDTDPFFPDRHPWLRPLPHREAADPAAAAQMAAALEAYLQWCRGRLLEHPVNRLRRQVGRPALDVVTTKWTGSLGAVPSFEDHIGIRGAAVTSSRLYRGFARLFGWQETHLRPGADLGEDIGRRIVAAEELIAGGAGFVHVHTKATDEAGHTKHPFAKRDVLEALDPGLGALVGLATRAVVAVTGDHATPSVTGLLHSGDPTPFLVAGPTVRADRVDRFGELPAASGLLGRLRAADVLPLLLGLANRPRFLGHRVGAHDTLALPDRVTAMPVTGPAYDEVAGN